MEIQIADTHIFVLDIALRLEEAEARAAKKRVEAISTGPDAFLLRLKPNDIFLAARQRRFEPFWHVAGTARYVYDRSRKYDLPVTGDEVKEITFQGQTYTITDTGKSGRGFALTVTENCREEWRQQVYLDALTGNFISDHAPLSLDSKSEITDLEELSRDDAIVVVPEVRASFAVRRLLPMMTKTVRADILHEETIHVDTVNLCYRPVWAFEFQRKSGEARGVVEVDAVTGQMRIRPALMPRPTRLLSHGELLDITKDAIGMIVPGGATAVQLGRVGMAKLMNRPKGTLSGGDIAVKPASKAPLRNRLPGDPTTEPPDPD